MTPVPVSASQIHAGVRSHLAGQARRIALAWGSAALAAMLILAWLLSGPDGWASGSPVPLLVDLAAVSCGAWAVLRYRRWRRAILAERAVSATMERAVGVPDGLLQGAMELHRRVPGGVSVTLAARSQVQVVQRFTGSPRVLAGDAGRLLETSFRRGVGVLAILAPAVVLLGFLNPGRALAAWRGLAAPLGVLSGPVLPPLTLEPGDVEVRRGEAAQVVVRAPLRQGVTLHWQAAGDVARSTGLEVRGDSAIHAFPEVSATVTYWASAPDGARSAEFRLIPVDPLFVTDVTVRLEFPAYTDRPAEEFRGDVPPLALPVGTAVSFQGRASRALASAELTLDGELAVSLPVSGPTFTGGWTPLRGGEYAWRFLDLDGAPAALHPAPLRVELLPDSLPWVNIALPALDTLLPTNLKQPLVLEAGDDYGLRSLELVAWRVTALGDTLEPLVQTADMGGSRVALARPLLDVSRWGLVPGDQVRYFARVRDVHPSGQAARTPVHVLRMPSAEELQRRAQMRLEDAAERLRQLQDEAARTAEETRDLERASRAPDREAEEDRFGRQGDQASFQEQEEVRRALEEQKGLAMQADSLGGQLQELADALKDAGASDPELARDLEELQRLLEEMGGEDLQGRMEELLERMDDMGAREAQQTLEDLTREQERFREQLEEALDRAQRAAVEQEFRSTTSEAEELAEEQKALAESMADRGNPELRARQQEELARETGDLQERMDQLAERLQEMGEEQALRQLDRAQASAQEARQGMQRAAEQAGERSSQAAETARQAAQEMDQAAQELQRAQEQMMAERAEAFQEALEQTAQDALALAREQARTRESMLEADPEEMAELRGGVSAVQQGVRSLAENVSLAARMAGADDRELSRGLGEAMEALSRTLESMERAGVSQPQPQAAAEQSIAALNQVARFALAAIQAMQEGGASAQPTPEQMMEQMEQLAQQQADVNNQAAQMMPMQLTPQAMQQMMEQMAQDQQQVASDLGQMSNQEGEEGPLGDLEALAQEAQALAEQLAGGRLDSETRERQERLFHRLLDAGRSLEKEEESTERESESAGAFERDGVAPLTAGDLGLSRFRLPDAATLNRLPPAARALVLQYFRRLNQGGGDGS
ncbi:MAG TPA: hypothetical protein VLA43_18580 [Longimicrobiales bacterium]|nr:hypothetical protein [Longimicrobiales bacterium]